MKLLATFLLLLLSIPVCGQSQRIDSLVNVLTTQKLTNAEQIPIYKTICVHYGHSDFNQLLPYCKKGLEVAQKEKDFQSISFFYEMTGYHYEASFKYDSAHIYYNEALDIAIKSGDKKRESQVYLSLGAMCFIQGRYILALDYFMEAEKISRGLENKATHIYVLGNIGVIHYKLKNYDVSISFFEQALLLAEDLPDYPKAKINPLYYLGLSYREKKEFEKALEYADEALAISRAIQEKIDESAVLQSIANIYLVKSPPDYEKAMEYVNTALQVAEEAGYPSMIADAWRIKSTVYKLLKEWKLCEEAASKAYETDSVSIRSNSPDIYENIVLANIHLGNKGKAEQFFNKFYNYMLDFNDKNLYNSVSDMQVKYETEKKEIRIMTLEKEKQLYVWLGVISVLLAVTLGVVLWQNIRNSRKEKQLIASRSILNGEMTERARLARDLHDRLSGNLSAIRIRMHDNKESLQNISEKLDGCIDEIRRVAHNLMPASLQFGLKTALMDFAAQFPNVCFHFFGQEKRFEERTEFILYCCASELVNNSVRHAGAENINLQLIQSDEYVSLTVQDDGCGFDKNGEEKGFGLKSVYDRVVSCNGKMDMVTAPGKGTETTIELKIKI